MSRSDWTCRCGCVDSRRDEGASRGNTSDGQQCLANTCKAQAYVVEFHPGYHLGFRYIPSLAAAAASPANPKEVSVSFMMMKLCNKSR